jgi:hypothetical protein
MKHEPIHHAPAQDEPPTTRLRPISDDIDVAGVEPSEDSADECSSGPIEATAVVSIDSESSYCVGFTERA